MTTRFASLALLLSSAPATHALTIELDYSHDTRVVDGTTGFFNANPVAKAALEAAALDLGRSITSHLGAIQLTDAQTVGATVGGTTVNFDPKWTFTDPTVGGTVTLNGLNLVADTFRIYVGSQLLTGSTLGQGGHGGFGYSASGSFGGNTADYIPAINAASSALNTLAGRGAAATIGTLGTSTFTVGGTPYAGTVNKWYGPTLGQLWFDADTNNDGSTDSAAQLASQWHFDHTTVVTAGKSDFYSVALHEMIHALGLGSSASWTAQVGTDGNGNGQKDWLGAEAIALKGTGTDLVDAGGAHIAEGITGTRITSITTALISDGIQEAAMDPSILTGTRKGLTDIDQAFMRDVGYATTTAIPEPSTYGLLGVGAPAAALAFRRRRRPRVA